MNRIDLLLKSGSIILGLGFLLGCGAEQPSSRVVESGEKASFILFSRGGTSPGLHIVKPSGGKAMRLTDAEDRFPSWSPSGTKIAFARGDTAASAILYIADFDDQDNELQNVTSITEDVAALAWAQDEESIAVAGATGLRLVNLSTRRSKLIETSNFQVIDSLSWPSADVLYVSSSRGVRRISLSKNTLDVPSSAVGGVDDSALAVGPGGSMAFSRAQGLPIELQRSLFVLEGGELRRITHERAVDGEPSWSPDGRQIVFTRFPLSDDGDWSGPAELFIIERQTGRLLQLTDNALPDGHPSWRPTGRRPGVADD